MRSSANSYIDLLMLNRINNYKIDLCLPNLQMHDAYHITIYDNKMRRELINLIIRRMKLWFNINMKRQKLNNLIYKCADYGHLSMVMKPGNDPLTYNILSYLMYADNEILYKYVSGSNVLDIDSNKYKKTIIYTKLDVKYITLLETSSYLRKYVRNNLKKYQHHFANVDLNIVNAHLEEFVPDDKIIYDTVVIRHVLDIDETLIEPRVKNINQNTKKGSIVVVFMMDGDKINILTQNTDYIIRVEKEIKFGLFRFNDTPNNVERSKQKILIYMNRIFAYDKGFLQDVVSPSTVISFFEKYNFILVNRINMPDVVTTPGSKIDDTDIIANIKKSMTSDHFKILDLFDVLIFRKM